MISASLWASCTAGSDGVGLGGDVGELARLLGHGLADFGPTVAGIDHPETGDAVEVLAAVDVPELGSLALGEDPQAVVLGHVDPGKAVGPHVLTRHRVNRIRRWLLAESWPFSFPVIPRLFLLTCGQRRPRSTDTGSPICSGIHVPVSSLEMIPIHLVAP